MKKIPALILLPLIFSFFIIGKTIASDLYWINNSGTWGDGAHWSTSSGGKAVNKIPTANDNVFFDENSFDKSFQKINISGIAQCKNFTCSPDILVAELHSNNSSQLFIYGSLFYSEPFENYFFGDIYFVAPHSKNKIQTANKPRLV